MLAVPFLGQNLQPPIKSIDSSTRRTAQADAPLTGGRRRGATESSIVHRSLPSFLSLSFCLLICARTLPPLKEFLYTDLQTDFCLRLSSCPNWLYCVATTARRNGQGRLADTPRNHKINYASQALFLRIACEGVGWTAPLVYNEQFNK